MRQNIWRGCGMNKTKKSIFDAAIKIFSKSGYNGATMDEIALEAGVAKGTLYYHFKSKEEIFRFIINEGLGILADKVNYVEKNENPIDNLKNICRAQLAALYENKDFFKVLLSQLWGQEIRQLELRQQLRKYVDRIELYIKDAIKKGYIREGNANFMAYAFFGSLLSVAVYEVINIDHINLDEIVDNLVLYNLKGLEKR